jgi:hypothetical protein
VNGRKLSWAAIALVVVALIGCSPAGSTTQTPQLATPTATQQPATPSSTPTTVVASPTPTEAAADWQAVAAVVGPQEVVFDWTTDRCAPDDFPDMPVRAFRDASGQVQLNRSRPQNRRFIGPDLDNLVAECDVVLDSTLDPDHANYDDEEWIQALYTEDGQTIHAIIHNEDNCTPEEGGTCWYQNMTYAVSADGGQSYQQPEPPGHLVAALPYRFEPGQGVYGLVGGSNIVKGQDGYYYMLAMQASYGSYDLYTCLLRTPDLGDPTAWRAWDGQAFDMTFVNPYQQPDVRPAEHTCPAISFEQIRNTHESITYNTYLDRYLLVGSGVTHEDGRQVWGIHYAFSDDLIHWSPLRLLVEMPLSAHYGPGGPDALAYPVLLDPDSRSRNFETSDKDAYVYFQRFNYSSGVSPTDVDLVRFPIEFFASEAEAQAADVRTSLSLRASRAGDSVMLTGDLATMDGDPVAGEPLDFTFVSQEGPGVAAEQVLSGNVPSGADGAVVGLRINTECNCAGPADLSLYGFRYAEDGGTANRVPNADFEAGLSNWGLWGTAEASLESSDRDAGSMLRVNATADQHMGLNSLDFQVTPGAPYTFTVAARVAPQSAESGYFVVVFLTGTREIQRFTLPFEPASLTLGSATTDGDGSFTLAADLASELVGEATARFAGSSRLWPSSGATDLE